MKFKKKYLVICLLIILFLIYIYLNFIRPNGEIYEYESNKFSYSENRGKVEFEKTLNYVNDSYVVYNINFLSRKFLSEETRIYANLYLPKDKTNVPGIVYLPGGGMKKEQAYLVAKTIVEEGVAVLVIDQRGIGQTGGSYLSMDQDYAISLNGNEPIQHLSVYDALRSFDVLREIPEVNKNKIAIGGESMGARYAIIAAAFDKRIKGLIVISSGGFNYKPTGKPFDNFMMSIDPDNYIGEVSPRPVYMIHGTNDSVVPIQNARVSYFKTKEPKKFYSISGMGHGYSPMMNESLKQGLKDIFGQ